MTHAYSREEAERILESFPAEKLDELLALAHAAYDDGDKARARPRPSMPDGWKFYFYGNCIDVRYREGHTELQTYYVPEISIEYLYKPEIVAKKSVHEHLALGHCSCGKRMPVLQTLAWACRKAEDTSIWWPLSRAIGYATAFAVCIYIRFSPQQRTSLRFNRHYSCI